MNSDILIYEAKEFYNTFIYLEQLRDQEHLLFYVPTVVNGAFAIELTLKAILVNLNIQYNKEHNLLSLFNLLPDELKVLFWRYLVIKAPEFNDQQKQIEELTLISNAFVDMRYLYEVRLVPTLNTRFLSAFANAAIYIMFSLGLNVDIEKSEKEKSDLEIERMFEENRKQYIESVNRIIKKDNKHRHKKNI